MTQPPDDAALVAIQEQAALVWTLRSQARVGSYQHEVSSAPHMILAAEEAHLCRLAALEPSDKGVG